MATPTSISLPDGLVGLPGLVSFDVHPVDDSDLVELVSREGTLPFGVGARHRRAILERLAVVEPRPRQRTELRSSDPGARSLRLAFAAERA